MVKYLRYIDLFCGIGGFHLASKGLGLRCVFASDIDREVRLAYERNFGLIPHGDITQIAFEDVPDHDLLFAGFPCQPFSIIGKREGFSDPRGRLFFEVLDIVRAKRPAGIVLENVRQLVTHEGGAVIETIKSNLKDEGYTVDFRVLNALDFGLPQNRRRVIIVASLVPFEEFPWPSRKHKFKHLAAILEKDPDRRHFVSPRIRKNRQLKHTPLTAPSIWHENKAGNISSHPWSCALRANASYNYLLVDGRRRLTPREMLRLQGFPESFKIISTDSQIRKQAGNAVPVPVAKAVIRGLLDIITSRQMPATTSMVGGAGLEPAASCV